MHQNEVIKVVVNRKTKLYTIKWHEQFDLSFLYVRSSSSSSLELIIGQLTATVLGHALFNPHQSCSVLINTLFFIFSRFSKVTFQILSNYKIVDDVEILVFYFKYIFFGDLMKIFLIFSFTHDVMSRIRVCPILCCEFFICLNTIV